jgi:hypothetical protein
MAMQLSRLCSLFASKHPRFECWQITFLNGLSSSAKNGFVIQSRSIAGLNSHVKRSIDSSL